VSAMVRDPMEGGCERREYHPSPRTPQAGLDDVRGTGVWLAMIRTGW